MEAMKAGRIRASSIRATGYIPRDIRKCLHSLGRRVNTRSWETWSFGPEFHRWGTTNIGNQGT